MLKYSLILLLIFCSCGARKVERRTIDLEEKTEIFESNIQTNVVTRDSVVIRYETKYLFEPIDNTQEFIIDSKVFKNVRLSGSNESSDTRLSTKKDSSSEAIKIAKEEKRVAMEEKQTERREAFPFWIFIIVFMVMFYFMKKDK